MQRNSSPRAASRLHTSGSRHPVRGTRTGLLLVALAPALAGQSLNVDVGTLAGSPSAGYGAAAAQPGAWNALPGDAPDQALPLVDLSGQPIAATLRYESSSASCDLDFVMASGATGDDAALLDDHHDFNKSGSCLPGQVEIAGLEPGIYDVYTYAFESLGPTLSLTKVTPFPAGLTTEGLAGGATWGGAHVLGETYTLHTVGTTYWNAIQLAIDDQGSWDYKPFNGVQLVQRESFQTYCTAKTTSCNTAPVLSTHGLSSVSMPNNHFTVVWTPVPSGPNPGILIATTDGPLATPFQHPLGYGWMCITAGPGFVRVLPPVVPSATGFCQGLYQVDFGAFLTGGGMPAVNALVASQGFAHVDAQGWYRDPASVGGSNLTGAVRFTVIP